MPVIGGMIVLLGRPIETNFAQPLFDYKVRTLGQVVETDFVNPIGERKLRLLGQPVETDSAQVIGVIIGVIQKNRIMMVV